MDEQWLSDDIADDPRHDLDRVIRRSEFEQPGSWSAWTGQLEVIGGQPDHEDLGLDRAFDVEAVRIARHIGMVRRSIHRRRQASGSDTRSLFRPA
jgi:hypothetical protein